MRTDCHDFKCEVWKFIKIFSLCFQRFALGGLRGVAGFVRTLVSERSIG